MARFHVFLLALTLTIGLFFVSATTNLRAAQACPNCGPVDITANGAMLWKSLNFTEFTPYMEMEPAVYNFVTYLSETKEVITTDTLNIRKDTPYTVVVSGFVAKADLIPIQDGAVRPPAVNSYLRFFALIPDAPALDLIIADGIPLFKNVTFKTSTSYKILPQKDYILQVRITGSDEVLFNVNATLNTQNPYTVWAEGVLKSNQTLGIVTQDL